MTPDLSKFAPYRASSIEQQYQYTVPIDILHTSLLDFVDMEKFKPSMNEFLAAADEPLVAGANVTQNEHYGGTKVSRSTPSGKETSIKGQRSEVTWLRRTEYLSSEASRSRSTSDRPAAPLPAAPLQLKSKKDALEAIESSFECQPKLEDLRHPTNPQLQAVRALPILPCGSTMDSFAQCTFDADPWIAAIEGVVIARDAEQRALVKAMSNAEDPNDTFVWYYLPIEGEGKEEEFLYVRDYDIQRVDRHGHSYFVLSIPESSGSAVYSPISGHFNMKKRRIRADSFRQRHFLKVERL